VVSATVGAVGFVPTLRALLFIFQQYRYNRESVI
jgi:hypothetical protein